LNAAKKVKTYTVSNSEGTYCVLRHLSEIEHIIDDEQTDDDYPEVYTITIEKKYTERQLERMAEFDGF